MTITGIIKRGQSCLFEASARQDDPKTGKKFRLSGHEDNFKVYQRSDFLASRLEVK